MEDLALCWEQCRPTQPQALQGTTKHRPTDVCIQVTLTAVLSSHVAPQLGAGDIEQERMGLSMSSLLSGMDSCLRKDSCVRCSLHASLKDTQGLHSENSQGKQRTVSDRKQTPRQTFSYRLVAALCNWLVDMSETIPRSTSSCDLHTKHLLYLHTRDI